MKLFGTDGIRGPINKYPMVPDVIQKLAMAATKFLKTNVQRLTYSSQHKLTVVIGKDTRVSGYMVENALTSGFLSMGADVLLLGPVPTPAVAMLTHTLRAHLGVMISASHNPFQDNGIKFFDSQGFKLTSDVESKIEKLVFENEFDLANAENLGKAKRIADASGRYIEFVKSCFPREVFLDGLKIVVDCANGAAYKIAPDLLWELGADVISIGNTPNGMNINSECGATHTKALQKAVIAHHADIGIALDGDADRLIVVDEKGQMVDADQIMATIASFWASTGILKGGGIVTTHMSNLGLERYLQSKRLELFRANVGDKYVLEMMHDKGCNLGGEQSGHIILSDYATTGDGLVAALQVLALVVSHKIKASDIGLSFRPVPQVLKNLRTKTHINLKEGKVRSVIESARNEINAWGRILVRQSGTEPLIRIMAQGDDEVKLDNIVRKICMTIEDEDIAKAF